MASDLEDELLRELLRLMNKTVDEGVYTYEER